eukprot:CAMPEP_0172595082 /NCGR_PEP_ID=MMETSP1068-20121228/14640_1 /TAXON_ID=35684 /ORGANISM="Pseudopedinella elastica, Strain CCMP716" /LENGTH=169 /DNA_ID=CAMNT_0013393461 /DNA_START=40 /DNA_END=549 /DNA_ORIENTATION=+
MRKGRPSSKLNRKPQAKQGPKPNWIEIAASKDKLPQEDGKIVAVSLPSDDKFVLGKILMVLRKDSCTGSEGPVGYPADEATYYCLGSSCTKCKFPLMKSDLDEQDETLICGVCGSKYSYKTGAAMGTVKKEGVAGWFGNVMSNNSGGAIEAYQVRGTEGGKYFAAIGVA